MRCRHSLGLIPDYRKWTGFWREINARKMVRLSKSNHICFASLGRYLYRHSKLSCEPCEEGMFQVFHDLLRETFCCTDNDRCNDPDQIIDTTKGYVSLEQDRQ